MLNVTIRTHDTGPINLPDLRPALDTIADTWTHEIASRTRSGRGVTGRALRRKRDGSPSTLTDTGALLASLRPTVDGKGFRIRPTGRRNLTIGAIHQATGRKWAGASAEQIDSARRAVVEAIQGTR